MAKWLKTCSDLCANLISTKVSASHRKSTQVRARPGQTESQVDPSFQRASTWDSVWPGLSVGFFICNKTWDFDYRTQSSNNWCGHDHMYLLFQGSIMDSSDLPQPRSQGLSLAVRWETLGTRLDLPLIDWSLSGCFTVIEGNKLFMLSCC